jgi:malate synthase
MPGPADSMTKRVSRNGLQVAEVIDELVSVKMIPGTGLSADAVWLALSDLVSEFSPKIRTLLQLRDDFQFKIDSWHRGHRDFEAGAYRAFLEEIGYLVPEGPDFNITTSGVVPEIAGIAGPQLVVPVNNARYALNAANARWGSLYDALYGTDVIPGEHSWIGPRRSRAESMPM